MFKSVAAPVLALVVVVLLAAGCQQQAASYPNKPIEYVVHSSAGGGTDVMARKINDIFTKEKLVPQTVTVVNKSGGSGAVASAYIAEKKGDPNYIYSITGVQVKNTLVPDAKLTLKDQTPVANLVFDVVCVVVKADSPYKTLQDLIDYSKTAPKVTQGGGSITSDENVTGYLIRKGSGAKWEFASFNSGGEALTALLGGHVDLVIPSPTEVVEHVRAGKARILAVSSEKRLDFWPDVPTLKELGLPYRAGSPRGIAMPPGVPADTVKYWEDTFSKMRQTEAWKSYLRDEGFPDAWMPAKEFGPYLDETAKSYKGVMDEMGLLNKK